MIVKYNKNLKCEVLYYIFSVITTCIKMKSNNTSAHVMIMILTAADSVDFWRVQSLCAIWWLNFPTALPYVNDCKIFIYTACHEVICPILGANENVNSRFAIK